MLYHRLETACHLRRLLALAVARGSSTVVLPSPRWHPGEAFGAALRRAARSVTGLKRLVLCRESAEQFCGRRGELVGGLEAL